MVAIGSGDDAADLDRSQERQVSEEIARIRNRAGA